jgi:two-component system, OmpR family, sensor kinase
MKTLLRHFDSLAVRTIVVVLLGIGLVHLASLWTYQAALHHEVTVANDTRLADRLIALKRTIIRTDPDAREMVAHDLSGGPIEAHWSKEPHASPGGPGSEEWQGLEGRLKALVPEIADGGIVVGANRTSADDPHLALISMRLPDQSWINVSLVAMSQGASAGHGTLLSTSLMALGAILISVFVVRWIGKPLSVFAAAAGNIYRGTETALVAEEGPTEVKALATAFNDMQRRIKKLIDDRTNALAAVSHDLRTPLTRLRLRTEDIADSEAKAAVSADLDIMERMIDQTLQFLRGDKTGEVVQNVDLTAIIQTIVDDFGDRGSTIAFQTRGRVALEGRHLTLKRCFENIIGNALKYGVDTAVSISVDRSTVVVTIADRGPGIADADRGRVFEPFIRLESSRNSDTGGFGLGLAIAKQAVETHGGTIDLSDHQPCGLLVTIHLPLKSTVKATGTKP